MCVQDKAEEIQEKQDSYNRLMFDYYNIVGWDEQERNQLPEPNPYAEFVSLLASFLQLKCVITTWGVSLLKVSVLRLMMN